MTVHFQIEYFTRWGEELRLEPQQQSTQSVSMGNDGKGHWFTDIEVANPADFTYRYILLTDGRETRREQGDAHRLPLQQATSAVVYDRWQDGGQQLKPVAIPFVRTSGSALWKGAGTAIPIFSLRSEEDFGIGQFSDLKLLADWAVATGQSVIQTLPVHDTIMFRTWRDSYPYRANSAFALHPIYINLDKVGKLKDSKVAAQMEKKRLELNALPQIDYEAVFKAKWKCLELLYADYGKECIESSAFQKFQKTNRRWLEPYAAFCYFRDKYKTPDFTQWKEAEYDPALVAAMCTPGSRQYNKVAFYMFIQFHLDKQLSEAKKYCNRRGILLKGDIPIGISRTSADAWVYPRLYNMDCQAGAPPDDFARDGQTWGFPTYNWDEMSRDGYGWFNARFRHMANHFDAYRIDHLLGFFRIWEIPVRYKSGLMGRFNPALPYSPEEIEAYGFPFNADAQSVSPTADETNVLFLEDTHRPGHYHPRINAFDTEQFAALTPQAQEAFRRLHDDFYYNRHEQFWKDSALSKLPALTSATEMLVCGEDLGMIPACVPQVMDSLQILSLEIQRMPKQLGVETGNPAEYPYMSVCTASSHDMSGIRTWLEDEAPEGIRCKATPERCAQLLQEHLDSPSMLAIFPLQDWLATDGSLRYADAAAERINVPANPDNYWRYRMHLSLEQLSKASAFNQSVKAMIARSGRI